MLESVASRRRNRHRQPRDVLALVGVLVAHPDPCRGNLQSIANVHNQIIVRQVVVAAEVLEEKVEPHLVHQLSDFDVRVKHSTLGGHRRDELLVPLRIRTLVRNIGDFDRDDDVVRLDRMKDGDEIVLKVRRYNRRVWPVVKVAEAWVFVPQVSDPRLRGGPRGGGRAEEDERANRAGCHPHHLNAAPSRFHVSRAVRELEKG